MNNTFPIANKRSAKPSMISGMIDNPAFEYKDRSEDAVGSTIYLRGERADTIGLNVSVYSEDASLTSLGRTTGLTRVPRTPSSVRYGDDKYLSYRRTFWNKVSDSVRLDVAVANAYMRSRSAFALASATALLSDLPVSIANSTIKYIAANITEEQARRHLRSIRGGRINGTCVDDIRDNCSAKHTVVHLATMGHWFANMDRELKWRSVHDFAKQVENSMRTFQEAVTSVVPQSGDNRWWVKSITSPLKSLGAAIRRFAQFGLAGRIIVYAAVTMILGVVMKRIPWWAVVIVLTCAELGWIREISQDIADILPRDQEEEFQFDCGRSMLAADLYPDTFEAPPWFLKPIHEDDCCDVEPQSGAAVTVLATGVTAIIARRVPLYTKIVNGPKFRSGLEDILHGVEGAFESTVNLVLRAFGSKRIFKIKKEQTAINKFCDGVDKLDVEVRARGCEIDDAMFQKFAGFIGFGEEALTQWPRDTDEWRKIKKSMGVLTKLSCDYPAHFNNAKARIEPIGLMLAGEPGLGKTTLLKAITKIVARYEFPDEPYDASKHMFQKPVGPYYEGYKGQTVFCVDDIFTKKPVAGEVDGDAETVVKLINQWPLALNMANCALKGRFYMTSPYVIATTNMSKLEDLNKAVTTNEAIIRRFPLWYTVHRQPGVEITPGCNPDEVWTFTKTNFSDTGNTAEHINFTELMHMLFEERRRRIRFAAEDAVGDTYIDQLFEGLESCRAVDELRNGVVAQAGGAGLFRKFATRAAAAVLAVGAVAKATGTVARCAVRRIRAFVGREAPIIMNKLIGLTVKMAARATALAFALYVAYKGIRAMIFATTSLFGKTRKPEHSVVPQSAVRDEVVELVQRNMFTVQCGDQTLGFALGLDDMTMVMPAHFLENSERQRAPLIAKGRRANYVQLERPSHVDQKRDLAYFRVKTMCKDITKSHIASEPKERELLFVKPGSVVACSTTLQPRSVRYSGACGRAPVERMLHVHTARTRYGDCGAIVMACTGKGGRRIYGMHTACDLGAAYYAGCYTTFGPTVVAQSSDSFCGHKLIRKIEKPVHNGGDTRLEPTPYAGCNGPVKTLPSLKRPADGVDPMLKAIEGYKRDWCGVPPEMGPCVKAVVAEIFEAIKGYNLGPTSTWEAAAGIAGEPYCKGLARGKSPGYPFIEKYHDKKKMLGEDGPYVQGPAYEELVTAVEELRAKYKRGEQGAVYRDSLKDEPRKIEKIRNCQTRMISGCPVELAVLGRTQTLRFTSALMMTRHEHGIMPGFNPYGVEANQLYHKLAFVNKKRTATAGDYKEFDKTQHPAIMGDIWAEISRRLVGHGCDADVLQGLGMDTFNAMHLGGNSYVSDTIYQVDGTLPSGHWMTSFLNSIYNAVVLRYCWVKHKGSVAYVYDFCRHVSAVYYGDDFVMAVDDEHSSFGLDVLQKYVKDLGMTMTDEEGNYGGAPNKDLLEVSFLCRKFRIDDSGLVWMPLETDSIDDMYNWKKKSTPISTHTEAIVRASLMEAAAHDMQTFVRYYRLAQEIAPKYVERFPEMSLPLEAAYEHWKVVHKGHIPIWSDDDDTPC